MDAKIYHLTSQKKRTSHVLHLLLCIPTAGLWLIIWAICGLSNSMENRRIDRLIEKELAKGEEFSFK
jgi:hypothetical protein